MVAVRRAGEQPSAQSWSLQPGEVSSRVVVLVRGGHVCPRRVLGYRPGASVPVKDERDL